MADLQFSQDCAVAVEQLKDFARRIHGELHGNGQKGFMEKVNEFMTTFEAVETERHRENTERLENISSQVGKKSLIWTIAGVLVAIAALVVGTLSIYVAVKIAHGELHITHPFGSDLPPTYDARSQ